MRTLFYKFFSEQYSAEKKLFHYAMLLSTAECLVIAVLSRATHMNIIHTLLMLAAAVVSYLCILASTRMKNDSILRSVYFVAVFLVIVPMVCYYADIAICVFPCYLITGIVFATILLKGTQKDIIMALQIIVDIVSIYLAIVVKDAFMSEQMQDGTALYVRVLSSILITGTVCGLLIAYRNQNLKHEIRLSKEMQKEAEQQNYAKDMFMVNVSHEIRTPLNAILGTTELLLDLDTNDKVKESVFYISNSSKALLSITNDLMDFSKIDSESIQIETKEYDVSEIFNDLINMFTVRFADCNAEILVDIEPDLPAVLVGDGAKIKQIILNYMTTIMKSFSSGKIYINVSGDKTTETEIAFKVSIDAKGNFKYLNSSSMQKEDDALGNSTLHRSEYLGESIIKTMGGELEKEESAYRRSYSFVIPQSYGTKEVLVEKAKYNQVKILLYENTEERTNSFVSALEAMGISYVTVATNEMFYQECVKKEYTHIILASERYEGMSDKLKELLEPQRLILIKAGIFSFDDDMIKTTIVRPISCLSIDALLAGKKNYAIRDVDYGGRFECPDAKIMVVDDNVINLEVAGELLKKYNAKVITAISGKECLNYLQEEAVDFILLDYMMPEMDGIDTLKNIRALGIPELEKVPIVVLTANAVSGAREMFMNAGFDEYISKPIEIRKFEKIIKEFMPPEKIVYIGEKGEEEGNEA